jgi:catechol 2,3-dioxygenase-like lactoylglutathione lyase family enzyme
MEHIIACLLRDFEVGKMNRRQLIQSLAVAASAGVAVGMIPTAAAAAETSLKPVSINHISYRVANYAKTRDFYSGLLGMKVSGDSGTQCRLAVGGVFIVAQPGETEATRRTPMIDHVAYTMDNTADEILAAMNDHGVKQEHELNHAPSKYAARKVAAKGKEEGNTIQVKDPDGFHVTLVPKG